MVAFVDRSFLHFLVHTAQTGPTHRTVLPPTVYTTQLNPRDPFLYNYAATRGNYFYKRDPYLTEALTAVRAVCPEPATSASSS